MSKKLISILLPVFNAAPFLKDCIDSILQQTETNWELLAVNDYSKDESWKILQQYASRDARIHIFQNTAKGIIPALRLAFAKSKGQYITRMDADDKMTSIKLSWLKTALTKKGKGYLSTGHVQYFSDTTLGEGYTKYQNWLNSLCKDNSHFREIYKECVIPSPCWMMYREDLVRCGAFNPSTYPEDYDLTFRIYANEIKPTSVKEVLHLWRDHSQRSSRTDPNYENQNYFDLKLPYFLKLDHNPNRPLILWGAGKKAKVIAKKLIALKVPFHWICNNPKKWGKDIYGIELQPTQTLITLHKPQMLIAIASPKDQEDIKNDLKKYTFRPGIDYFFFC